MATGLAARCPACATVFRVVPDQLRVSEGWVRCGRCNDVFNASASLIDLAAGPAGAPAQPPGSDQARPAADKQDQRAGPPTTVPTIDSPDSRFADQADFVHSRPPAYAGQPARLADLEPEDAGSVFDKTVALEPGLTHRLDDPPPMARAPASDHTFNQDVGLDHDQHHDHDHDHDHDRDHEREQPAADLRADPHDMPLGGAFRPHGSLAESRQTPSFVRRADRAQRWRQPRVRAALAGVAVLAALGLAAQVAYTYRDLLAARLPATRTALEQTCGWIGCTVGAAQAIESFTVESSGLLRVERSNVYKLSVALRNRAAIEVALPAVELALTDSQGRLLARRVLRPAELGSTQTTLAPGRDLPLQATLQTTFSNAAQEPVAVAGYTVEIFYP